MAVEITVYTREWVTREADPDDRWDRGDTDGYVSGVRARWVPGNGDPVSWRAERFDVACGVGSTVYVVVAHYETGDTFGRTGGQYDVLDVLPDADSAMALAQAARAVGRSEFTFSHNGKDYGVSWTGYFERLDDIRVWPVIVSA